MSLRLKKKIVKAIMEIDFFVDFTIYYRFRFICMKIEDVLLFLSFRKNILWYCTVVSFLLNLGHKVCFPLLDGNVYNFLILTTCLIIKPLFYAKISCPFIHPQNTTVYNRFLTCAWDDKEAEHELFDNLSDALL